MVDAVDARQVDAVDAGVAATVDAVDAHQVGEVAAPLAGALAVAEAAAVRFSLSSFVSNMDWPRSQRGCEYTIPATNRKVPREYTLHPTNKMSLLFGIWITARCALQWCQNEGRQLVVSGWSSCTLGQQLDWARTVVNAKTAHYAQTVSFR
mmetsp:Transcript_24868/g.41576  ORF Transcript_24868/g.41576 Transcript_24868/m.41576 type:complete len:151 (-) Transcript_24868:623-1075(-)